MNIFRFCGDMLHLVSIVCLLWKIHKSKSCIGVSCRMQEMYLMVFAFRYMDLLWQFISLYNSSMKIFFLISTGYLVYMMRFKPPINQTYDRGVDSFKYEQYLLGPCFALGFLMAEDWSPPEILWCTSLWLESVSLVPQLVLLQKMREVENLTSHFVAAMGAYRAFYILNWVYRYFTEDHFRDWAPVVGGLIQTGLYCDFFYYYSMSKWYGSKLVLPMAGLSDGGSRSRSGVQL